MTRIILIALLGVSLFFSTSVLARGGGPHGGYNNYGGHGGHQGHHYNKRHHGHHNRHIRRHHGYSAQVGYYPPPPGYYPPPPGYYPPPIGISLSYANHGTAIHYSSYPHGGFSIGYSHR